MQFQKTALCVCLALVWICGCPAAHGANFAGVWNLSMQTTQDACGLGFAGRTTSIKNVVIRQKGNNATLTLRGVKYKARVVRNKISGGGSYTNSGLKFSGSIVATLAGKNRINVPRSRLSISVAGFSCYVLFKGSGSKVG